MAAVVKVGPILGVPKLGADANLRDLGSTPSHSLLKANSTSGELHHDGRQ